jgi:hypothetical protein
MYQMSLDAEVVQIIAEAATRPLIDAALPPISASDH